MAMFLVLPPTYQRLVARAVPAFAFRSGTGWNLRRCLTTRNEKEDNMPILLWLLGVPLTLVVVLMLFHVV
jgi:hypothetical protein